MATDDGRDPSGQALAVPAKPEDGLGASRFDPSRETDWVLALHQYRNDMLYPPAADSRERRVAMIDALLRSGGPSPSVSSLTGFDPSRCGNCTGIGWVCENHPDRPWKGMTAPGAGCDCGAGSPCPVCNLRMASAGYTEPLRILVEQAISLLESAERETNWGSPLFGPSPSEEIKADLEKLRDTDGSLKGGDACGSVRSTTAGAEGIAR